MRKITKSLIGMSLFFVAISVNAQVSDECKAKASLMVENAKSKKYAEAKPDLEYVLKNCPSYHLSVYQRGAKVALKLNDAALTKKVYELRMKHFPDKKAAKAHSDYATFLIKNKLASDQEVFTLLEKAYAISPKDMSVKNIYRYFNGISAKYKDSDPQKVFDSYDNVMESVGEKLDDYSKKLIPLLKKEEAGTLEAKEKKRLHAYRTNSKALGQVEGGLDNVVAEIATCKRLIPMFKTQFESKKTDAVWLRRSVSRLHHKGCQSDPLYEKISRAYAKAAPSSDSYNFLAGVLEKNGDASGGKKMRAKAFNLETDPKVKAKLKLRQAYGASSKRARALAYEALKYNPNLGKAYLLIASLYQKSVNSCGTNEFEKRMVYVAALNKARKARSVDPGCGAGRYISNYSKQIPSKKLIHTSGVAPGSSHRVGCWIGETVKVPNM